MEPVSNLSASVDISGELLNAAIEIINEPVDKNQVSYSNNTESFDELEETEDSINVNAKNENFNDETQSEKENIFETKVVPKYVENKECETTELNIYSSTGLYPKIEKESVMRPAIKAYTDQQLSALYLNQELQLMEQFTNQFIEAELRGAAIKQHVLYDLLTSYLNARNKIVGNNIEIEQSRKEYSETHNLLWNIESSVVSGRGECQDGQTVTATHVYTKATFQRSLYQSIARILASIRILANESHTLHSYSAEVLKLQVIIKLVDKC